MRSTTHSRLEKVRRWRKGALACYFFYGCGRGIGTVYACSEKEAVAAAKERWPGAEKPMTWKLLTKQGSSPAP